MCCLLKQAASSPECFDSVRLLLFDVTKRVCLMLSKLYTIQPRHYAVFLFLLILSLLIVATYAHIHQEFHVYDSMISLAHKAGEGAPRT